jgi:hypothetical protein
MDKITFTKGINAFITLQHSYDNIEKALYGQVVGEGAIQDCLWEVEESLVDGYLGDSVCLSEYAHEAGMNYIESCLYGNRLFNINEFDAEISQALDDEAHDALIDN